MSAVTVAEAKAHLSELVERAVPALEFLRVPPPLGLRAHLAPLTVGTVRFGLAIGPIVRVGNLGRRGMAEPVVTLGARATLLAAWEFVRRFDWMIELGVDAASTVSGGLTLEHVLTPWATIALRIRP